MSDRPDWVEEFVPTDDAIKAEQVLDGKNGSGGWREAVKQVQDQDYSASKYDNDY